MNISHFPSDPKYLLRAGPNDHVLLDRLLTADFFKNTIKLDGIVLERAHARRFANARKKLAADAFVLVEPQHLETWSRVLASLRVERAA